MHAVVFLFTPSNVSAADHLSGQVVMHPDASWPPGSRNYGPSRGRQTGAFLQLFEENICPYPLFSIHALKRLSSLSTGADLLRRKLFNPSVPTAVKSSHGEGHSDPKRPSDSTSSPSAIHKQPSVFWKACNRHDHSFSTAFFTASIARD